MAHLRYRRFLDALVDDELSGTLAVAVAAHVTRCAVCGPAAELTVLIKASLATEPQH